MKKIAYLSLCIFAIACGSKKNTDVKVDTDTNTVKTDSVKTEVNKDTLLLQVSGDVLSAIKENNGEKIASYIHPKEGIRFSPYTNVDTTVDVKMSVDQFKEKWNAKGNKKIMWGNYSAGEETINMTMSEYFKRFVYDLDFLEIGETTVNDNKASGTMVNNIKDIYKDADFVEYYVPGVDKKFDGMDWRGLNLVFKKYEDKYYLIGIVHSEWTT